MEIKLLGRPSSCIEVSSDLITSFITMVSIIFFFLRFFLGKLPFNLSLYQPFLTSTNLAFFGFLAETNKIKKESAKFWEDLLYFQRY